ncbi:MAG: hypothetical protein LBB88_09765 [Planctomycetaceae bacterium]|nr:hypothetical protein [Planctomycetaceae bacterium]
MILIIVESILSLPSAENIVSLRDTDFLQTFSTNIASLTGREFFFFENLSF